VRRTRIRSVLVALVAVGALLGGGAPAAGQATTSDPYGPTVPPTEPPGDPSCSVDDASVDVGGTVTGSIVGLEAGAEVDLTLLGQVLATVVADADGEATFAVTVPEIAGVGLLVAVGVTFNVDCGELDPGGVLGEGTDRPGGEGGSGGSDVAGAGADRSGGSGSSGSGSGALARTGTTLVPLVVLALLALALGAYLRRRTRWAA
jgi:hypothetical protein